VSLRVAFDMDGTVADMYAALRQEAERLFGADSHAAARPDVPPAAESTPARLTSRQQSVLWERVRQIEDFWTTLPEQEPGIIARIAATAEQRRWEVIFITTRPASAGETTQRQTQRWLEDHGFRMPSVFVLQRSRGKLAAALHLDAVVDDRPENCLDVAVDSTAKPLLIWPASDEPVPDGLRRMGVRPVPSISQAVEFLERLDDSRGRSAVVRSIRKLLRRDDAE
jgi:hypothetical protein